MNSQPNQKITARKLDSSVENESTEIINSVSRLEPIRTNKTAFGDDELILSLQNRRENRRAQQVFEWEAVRRGGNDARQFVRGVA